MAAADEEWGKCATEEEGERTCATEEEEECTRTLAASCVGRLDALGNLKRTAEAAFSA
jgi:hypothetical protein